MMIRCDLCGKLEYESSLTLITTKGFLCQVCSNKEDEDID